MSAITSSRTTSDQPKRAWRRRGFRFYIKRGLLALIALLLALPVLGLTYETMMAALETGRFPPPGRLVTVDGHKMHIHCTGDGSPTVVMDAGLGGWSLDWSAVQPAIARFTRVCSYDRAGLGWSEPGPAPGDARQAVADLHTLLVNSGEQGPFVVVGHSNGGLRALLLAHAYPDAVAGVVLVDPTPLASDAEQFAFLTPVEQAEYLALVQAMKPALATGGFNVMALIRTLQPVGVPRLLTAMFLEDTPYVHLSAEAQPAFRFGMNQRARLATYLAETEQRQGNIANVRAVDSIGALPLAVLTSTTFAQFYGDPLPVELSGRLLALGQKTLWEAEVALAQLSSNSTIAPVERSGHYIQFDRPDAVIDAVQAMVKSLEGR